MNIVEEARKFVEEECKKPTSKYGEQPYENHFVPMHAHAKALAEKLGADAEVVELAAWLHDIGSIICGRENHHITGAEIAGKKLSELGYSDDKIAKVRECILTHRGSQNMKKESVEAQIIADADAMSSFDNISGIFMAAFVFEKQDQKSAKNTTRQKLENCWNKISAEAKEIVKPKYEAAMLLLQ